MNTAIIDISTSIIGFSTSQAPMEWQKNAETPFGISAGYEEKSYSPLPCIQAFTLWPMRWVKARLKVL